MRSVARANATAPETNLIGRGEQQITEAVDDHAGGFGLLDEVEQVVDPLVDVEIDRRPAQTEMHGSSNDQPNPAAIRAELGRVLLERRQDRGPAVGGGAERDSGGPTASCPRPSARR